VGSAAEELPFEDERFDCVASVFGAVFAPRPEVMIRELFRVVRPGNTVGFTAWGTYGLQGEIFQIIGEYRPPMDLPAPSLWGEPEVVQERLAPYAGTVQTEKLSLPWEHESWDQAWQVFERNGPMVALREGIGEDRFAELRDRVAEHVKSRNGGTLDGPIALTADYLRIVARKRG
jgi:SAM-dependent methyltransferase